MYAGGHVHTRHEQNSHVHAIRLKLARPISKRGNKLPLSLIHIYIYIYIYVYINRHNQQTNIHTCIHTRVFIDIKHFVSLYRLYLYMQTGACVLYACLHYSSNAEELRMESGLQVLHYNSSCSPMLTRLVLKGGLTHAETLPLQAACPCLALCLLTSCMCTTDMARSSMPSILFCRSPEGRPEHNKNHKEQ